MNKCSPVDMRKNLQAVEMLRQAGIDFVPMVVTSTENKIELINKNQEALEKLFKESE